MKPKRELLIGLALIFVATSAYILGWTNVFTIKSVNVIGAPNKNISKQVLSIADIQIGQKLARIEPRSISIKLTFSGLDWIKSVDISRNWITRNVEIALSAREPIATSENKYVDSSGTLFTSPIEVNRALPELFASNTSSRVAALSVFLNLPMVFTDKTRSISATSGKNFQFQLKNGLLINWGDDSNSDVKMKVFQALIQIPENKEIKSMDISDPTKPTVM